MEPLKNLFSVQAAKQIAQAIHKSHTDFDSSRFLKGLERELAPLELKTRMLLLADRLEQNLPANPKELFSILIRSLSANEQDSVGLKSFLVWPLTEIVARRGEQEFDLAMTALVEMTQRFTSEYAIRPFLRKQPQRTLEHVMRWTEHENEHVRRLASEGTRPLLPWGEKLPEFAANPQVTQPILDRLHTDPSEYVRRSVANHLNDHSKSHPEHVIQTLQRWRKKAHPTFASMANKAARTLIKQGDPQALELIGFTHNPDLLLQDFELQSKHVEYPGTLYYKLTLHNQGTQEIAALLDYAIHLRKANGTLNRKVFKGRKLCLAPKTSVVIEGKHPFRPISTRKYHSGEHRIEPILNGVPFPAIAFELLNCS